MFGAQLFLLIVCILIGLGAGLSLVDAKNTFNKKKADHWSKKYKFKEALASFFFTQYQFITQAK